MAPDEETPPEKPQPPLPPLTEADWANAPTRGYSSTGGETPTVPGSGPPPAGYIPPSHGATEPATVFDASLPRPPREMKIAREGDAPGLTEGHIINERFEVRKCLGDGNVGTVYLVNDLRLKDKRALKLMHPSLVDSEAASQRFISEIKALQHLSHEHIIRIYDYGKTDISELSFFTMEYVEGGTLADLLKKRGGKLPLDKSLGLIRQILDTLAYAHQQTSHRNLKPVNIMVRPTGRVVLLNFGISTTASSAGLAMPLPRSAHRPTRPPNNATTPKSRTTASTSMPPGPSCTRCSPATYR